MLLNKRISSLFFLVIFVIFYFTQFSNGIIIETSLGRLRGYNVSTNVHRTVHIFKKVPYAAPPVGDLRFAYPQPPIKWNGVWDATEFGPGCMENSSTTRNHPEVISEDCLFLNFYTNDYCLKYKNCSTVFYIHGGAMAFDSPVVFRDNRMVENFPSKDVIMILAAYRLNVFSHLVFGDDSVVPRNLPIYDILYGLEFVNRELRNFGGNPNSVTVFGHSSGGNLALAMAFSKNIDPEQRLFQRVIGMSPSSGSYTLEKKQNNTKIIVEMANCTRSNVPEIVDCMRKVDAFELLRYSRIMDDRSNELNPFTGIFWTPPLFSFSSFMEQLQQDVKSRDILLGATDREYDFPQFDKKDDWRDNDVTMSEEFGYKNQKDIQRIFERDLVSGKLDHAHDTLQIFTATEMLANSMRRLGGNVYLYSITVPKGRSTHNADRQYILGYPFRNEISWTDADDYTTGQFYAQLYANFIKTGKPELGFKKLKPGLDNYLQVAFNTSAGIKPAMVNFYQWKVVSYFQHHLRKLDSAISYVKKLFFKDHFLKLYLK